MTMLQYVNQAVETLRASGDVFAAIDNPPGVYPPREVVPLGPVRPCIHGRLEAVFLDLDGTLTCTEPLFLHGVETVVRRATGWHDRAQWPGLDPEIDHPRIVGFSTLRNLEYLYECHGEHVRPERFFGALETALGYLLAHGLPDELLARLDATMGGFGLEDWWAALKGSGAAVDYAAVARRFSRIDAGMFSELGLMIFYADYLRALEAINRGEGARVSEMLFGDPDKTAVGPMPGMALLCALVKGWLPEACAAAVATSFGRDAGALASLCRRFFGNPVPVALVTSSGRHEVNLVLEAVFRGMREEVARLDVPDDVRASIVAGLEEPTRVFDTVVTCDDVLAGRTKPFRDPYSLALERLGLDSAAAQRVIGFEDTEVGIISQRGAGVGVPCALPIEFTARQDFSGAAHVLHGGMIEAVFDYGLFVEE